MIDRHSTTDVSHELIKRADSLKVSLWKNDDGSVSSSFELHGGCILNDDDQDADTLTADRKAALQFLRNLMRSFEKGT